MSSWFTQALGWRAGVEEAYRRGMSISLCHTPNLSSPYALLLYRIDAQGGDDTKDVKQHDCVRLTNVLLRVPWLLSPDLPLLTKYAWHLCNLTIEPILLALCERQKTPMRRP